MGTTFDTSDYVIQFDVLTKQVEKVLLEYIKFLRTLEKVPQKRGAFTRKANVRTASGRLSRTRVSEDARTVLKRYFDKAYIPQIKSMAKNLSAQPSSFLGKQVRESADEIKMNIIARIEQNFRSSRRLQNAINDSRSLKIQYGKGKVSVGIASGKALDDYTTIYVNRDETPYDPPVSYTLTSWWWMQEAVGAGPKTDFESFGTEWFVVQKPHPPDGKSWKPGFEPRPFLLFDGQRAEEDQAVIDQIPLLVRKTILASIDRRRGL